MSIKIHYEDNLFFLIIHMKALKSGLALDIDSEYFIDKVIEDILFIDGMLAKTFTSLKGNTYLLKRSDYLRGLHRAKKAFIDFMNEIIEGKLAFSPNLTPFFPKFAAYRDEHLRDCSEILALLKEPVQEETAGGDVISGKEYEILLENDPADEV